jgi:Leucine-rich repeat (LRR) protein
MIDDITKINGLNDIYEKIIELDLSNNRITEIKGLDEFDNLKILNLKNNYIDKIEGVETLKKLEQLDLSGNINIKEIPDTLNDLTSLNLIKLTGCRIQKFSDSVSKYFWMGQNYRYYTNFRKEDVIYYEMTHKSKAGVNERLYKNFVKWLFKLRSLMNRFRFNYRDIEKFEKESDLRAINSGKLTKAFLKFLDDKHQLRITNFL